MSPSPKLAVCSNWHGKERMRGSDKRRQHDCAAQLPTLNFHGYCNGRNCCLRACVMAGLISRGPAPASTLHDKMMPSKLNRGRTSFLQVHDTIGVLFNILHGRHTSLR